MMSYYRFYHVMLCDVYQKQKNIRVIQGTLTQCSLFNYICQPPPSIKSQNPCYIGSGFHNLRRGHNNNEFILSLKTVKVQTAENIYFYKFSLCGHIVPIQGHEPHEGVVTFTI